MSAKAVYSLDSLGKATQPHEKRITMEFDYDPDGNFTTHVTGQLSMYPGEPPIACPTPTCKADTGLTVSAVATDRASKVSCLNGHTWDEPRMPGKAAGPRPHVPGQASPPSGREPQE